MLTKDRFGSGSLSSLNAIELRIVYFFADAARGRAVRHVAIILNRCGNACLYPLIAISFLTWMPGSAVRPLIVAVIAIAILHVSYPLIKSGVARPRPFELSPDLDPLLPVLDRFSFPSGHVMTVTAMITPLAFAFPESVWLLTILWAALTWARITCAHHFPTDIAAGTILGFSVAYPLSAVIL